jgi:4-aminobutyrate aminotransferase
VVDDDLQGNAKRMGERFAAGVATVAAETPWIAELRGCGLMWALEICHPGGIEPDPARTTAVLEATKRHRLLVGKGGLYGNVIRLAPMLNVTAEEIDEGVAALIAAITEID